jgi:hypothetical protein
MTIALGRHRRQGSSPSIRCSSSVALNHTKIVARPSVLLRVASLLTLGMLAGAPPPVYAQVTSSGLPAPKGLSLCASSDPLAVVEASVAAKFGGAVLGCFKSQRTITVQGATKPILVPFEFAIAIDFPGPYTLADLDKLLATGIEQWKAFEPLSKESEDYTVRLNDLIKGANTSSAASVPSVKPVLVSIGRVGPKSFSVVSIRSYVLDASSERLSLTKVNGSADVLHGSRLVRLTVQRVLTDPSDVTQVQSEIAEWANAVSSAPTDQGAGKQ